VFVYRLADGPAAGGSGGAAGGEAAAGATVERVLLRPLLEDKSNVEPAPGSLAAGDRVVIAGQAGLKDGAAVRVLDREAGVVAP